MHIKYTYFWKCGFHKSYNTQHCPIVMVVEWVAVLDKGKHYGALLTDLSKTFWFCSPWLACSKTSFIWFLYITTTYVRSGNFAGTIVDVTASFPQNLSEGKDKSFQEHFFVNMTVSESFRIIPRGKRLTDKDLYTKNDRFMIAI